MRRTWHGMFGSYIFIDAKDRKVNRDGAVYRDTKNYPPPSEHEISICRAFFSKCEKVKIPNTFSYGLKHTIERWATPEYVSNGACIEAARREGFPLMWENGGPNCLIGISVRSRKKLIKEKNDYGTSAV